MYRFSMKHRGRRTSSASALQHVAYILREQEGPAAAHVAYMLRVSERTRGREDLIESDHNLPTWAHGSAAYFWECAERFERANGRTATTWEITLPRELTRAEQLSAIRDLMETQFGTQIPYVWAMHEATALDGKVNPHFHVAFSSRTMDGIERSPEQFFARYNPDAPERGGAQKNMRLHARGALLRQREGWATIANWYLEQGGHTERIDARSLSRQGIEREPVKRLSSQELTQAKYRQVISDDLQVRIAGREARLSEATKEQTQARQAWEARKEALGLTPATTHAEMLVRVTQASQPPRPVIQETRVAYTARQQARIQEEHAHLTQDLQTVEAAQRILERQRPRVARGKGQEREEPQRSGYRARIFAEEQERERRTGPSW